MDVKNMWVSEIRKVLTGQLEACRGAFFVLARAILLSSVSCKLCLTDIVNQLDSRFETLTHPLLRTPSY